MILKRQSMRAGLGYAAFLTVVDTVASSFSAQTDQSGVSVLWSPITVFIMLDLILPQPPRVSFADQLRKPRILVLIVATIIACVVTFRYFPSYSRVFTDVNTLIGFWFALKRVPVHDVQLDLVPST